MTLMECREKRGWENNQEITNILDRMQLRIRKHIPDGELKLTRLQQMAIDTPEFWRDWKSEEPQNLMIQGATSAGKTLLAELATIDTLAHDRRRAIILVPLKSMVNERRKQFSNDMDPYFRVYAASSDYMEYDERLIKGDYDVAVIVYEKFFAMLSQGNRQIMKNCGLLVVDELAMLSKEQRGPKLELALEIVRKNHPDTRIMCLATSDCSSDKICRWLNIDKNHQIFSAARPVALEEHIVLLNGAGRYRTIPADCEELTTVSSQELKEEHLTIPGFQREWKLREKKKRLLQVVLDQLLQKECVSRILIFVGSQSEAASVASFLKDSMSSLFPLISGSARMVEYENFLQKIKNCEEDEEQSNLIQNLIPHGIAYHHAGLSTTLRELIEEEFQQEDSILKIIVATETLTIGVNMPFDAMIMLSNRVPRGEGEPVRLTQQEYRNYIGRAGRLGHSNHTGITYLFLEEQRDMSYYWGSYYNKEEIESALVSVKEKQLAPYYLSLLMDSNRKTFTQGQIDTLFKDSLTHVCRENRGFDADELYNALYNAYLANVSTDSGKGRGRELTQQYEIEKFGMHMAPYAFSVETCIDIYEKFYDGRKNHGLPWEITSEDVENDRYLLDILYHVCRHTEIENSSMLSYPRDDRNPSRLRKAKTLVISQLKNILAQTDPEGNRRYELWEQSEYSDLYRLMTEINLGNEDCIAEAAMRAVILFYWTKGKTVREICKITEFSSFTKVTSGDIDRIAEVASFHLDAINKCLSSAEIKNDSVVDSFYILQCRVKYGMTWNLVRLANKHVHGLDRNKLLQLEKAANERGMKPVDYLYCASVEELEEYITQTQRNSLMETLERRGEASGFTSLLEVVYKDAGSKLTNQQKKSIERIYSFERQTVSSLYNDIRDTVNDNALLPNIKVVSDGYPELLLWQSKKYGDIQIGILLDYQNQEQIDRVNEYFNKAREKGNAYFLLMPKCGETKDWKSAQSEAARTLGCKTVFDNEFFAMVLANAILKAIVEEDPLTAFFKDARGVFTVDEYKYFSLENYIGNGPTVAQSKLYLICDRSRLAYSTRFINLSELQTQIGKNVQYDVLPWGDVLEHMDEFVLEAPIVLMLEREMITRSHSLYTFINRLNQNRFRNNLLILASEDAQRKWNEPNRIETQTVGECHWNRDFCAVDQIVLHDTSSAAKAILDYCDTWKPGQFTIGISYAHEDSFEEQQRPIFRSDNILLKQVVDQLKAIYGEHQILFDQFKKANRMFNENQAREKSLEGYRTCKVCLILWNTLTIQNKNCIKEREAIFDHCKNSTARYIYLVPAKAPEVPEAEFGLQLNENRIQTIVNEVEDILRNAL